MSDCDAVVVGAGVIGASIALELQRHGRRVIVVDKGDAVGGASTSSSSSIVRFTYSTMEGVVASWESMHRWASWSQHLGPIDGPLCFFHRIGMLHITAPGDDMEQMRENFATVGVPHELLRAPEIARRHPALNIGRYHPPKLPSDEHFFDDPHGEVSALYLPDAGIIDDPQLAAMNLMDAAKREGATARLRSRVTSIDRVDGRVTGVSLSNGEAITAPVVVNAAGPWSAQLNALAGVLDEMNIGTRAMRQEVASTAAPAAFGVGTGGCVVGDRDLGTYARPQPGGSYLVGGIEADCDPTVWVDDPDRSNPNISVEMFEALVYRAAIRVPDLEIPHQPRGLADHYDVTDDWIPIYDCTGLGGYYLAIGTSGNQFKNAPLVGDILRTIIDACESGHDHDADPVSLDCPHAGQTIGLGHYSRLRQPANTSGTVMG